MEGESARGDDPSCDGREESHIKPEAQRSWRVRVLLEMMGGKGKGTEF